MAKAKNLLGFQVVDSNGDYPPDMCSFEVYPLDYCLKICIEDQKRWRLLPIFEGDIEEPSIIELKG